MLNYVFKTHQLATSVLIVVLSSMSAACTYTGPIYATEASRPAFELFWQDQVNDLLSVLPQIINPLKTTIQISKAHSGNSQTVISVLAEQGYGLQRVDADTGKYLLDVKESTKQFIFDGGIHEIIITIGSLTLSRSYGLIQLDQLSNEQRSATWIGSLNWRNDRAVIPTSELRVSGADRIPDAMRISVELKNRVVSSTGENRLEFQPSRIRVIKPVVITERVPTLSIINPVLINRVVSAIAPGQSIADRLISKTQQTNLFGLGANRLASVFDSHNRIIREYVIFPNDSQRLGKVGKRLLLSLVERFSINTDLFGLIGCSNGPTNLSIGNQGLAFGRSKRIAEELLAAGVPEHKIVEEGCWSATTGAEGFPNRGVVIDLWRRAG